MQSEVRKCASSAGNREVVEYNAYFSFNPFRVGRCLYGFFIPGLHSGLFTVNRFAVARGFHSILVWVKNLATAEPRLCITHPQLNAI